MGDMGSYEGGHGGLCVGIWGEGDMRGEEMHMGWGGA